MLIVVMDVCESLNKNYLLDSMSEPSFMKWHRVDWQNEIHQNKKNLPEFTCADRFIPKRFRPEDIDFNLNYVGKTKEQDLLKMSLTNKSSYWRQSSFVATMNNVFNIRENRLLQLSNGQSRFSRGRELKMDVDWTCKPRLRPMAFPTATNEMPDLCTSLDINMMDWSINDQLALCIGENLIIWRYRDDTSMIFTVDRTRSLKYSPDGKYLAIGCMNDENPVLELWMFITQTQFLVAEGKYLPRSFKSICCIEWTEDSKEILCGSKSGLIVVIQLSTMTIEHVLRKHTNKICCMRFSPSRRYLATADVQGRIYIFDRMTYEVKLRVGAGSGGIVFDWHPWHGDELAISEKSLSSIYIFNVPHGEVVASYQRGDDKIAINSITFSKITGELLVNIYRRDENCCPKCEIFVLSSLNRVVDILSHSERGAIFMMWSPDGTKLAAADMDDSFTLWEFYPKAKLETACKKQAQQVERRSVLELYTPLK